MKGAYHGKGGGKNGSSSGYGGKAGGGDFGKGCFNCGGDHLARDCPESRSGGKGGGYSGRGGGYSGTSSFSGKAPPRGTGPVEEGEMEVDDRDFGKIIGRQGMNIRDLQDGTGCRIIMPDRKADGDEPGMRTVKIRGTKEQIARCKDAIQGVLMGDEPKDVLAEISGAVLMRNIDPMSMSHLNKIKATIEKEHGVVLDLDARSARIWPKDEGNRDKAHNAKEAIEEAMEDITTVDCLTIPVAPNIVNQVINDPALRSLQDMTGLTANVAKTDEGTGIRLTGLAGAIVEAKKIIESRNQGMGASFLPIMPGMLKRLTPIKWGEFQGDIRFLMQNTGAEVDVEVNSTRLDLRGGPDEVRNAKHELQKILHHYFPQDCCTIDLPPESVDWIAGEDDRELLRLQSAGATASLDRRAATMWICGNPRGVEMTRNRIKNSLARWDREHVFLQLNSKGQCLAVIGSGGSTIRELMTSTGARIDVDANQCTIMISGKEDSVAKAKARVLEITGGHGGGGGGGGGGGSGSRGCYNCGGDHLARDCPEGGPRGSGGGTGGGRAPPPERYDPPPAPAPAPAPAPPLAGGSVAPRPAGGGRGASRW